MSHPYSMKSLPHAPGALIFTPCPGTQASDLAESLKTLKQAGAVALVTLMSDTELNRRWFRRHVERLLWVQAV